MSKLESHLCNTILRQELNATTRGFVRGRDIDFMLDNYDPLMLEHTQHFVTNWLGCVLGGLVGDALPSSFLWRLPNPVRCEKGILGLTETRYLLLAEINL